MLNIVFIGIQNQFVFWANAPGLVVSFWLNMAAAKLQYSDRMSTNMRSSLVQLLDSNKRSFAIPSGQRRVLGGDVMNEEEGNDQEASSNGRMDVKTFKAIRQSALDITTQKVEAPAPHEKVVVGGKAGNFQCCFQTK